MKMKVIKGYRLNYRTTHKKIEKAIENIMEENEELTVHNVADRAGISLSTAYNHKCQDMILEIIDKEDI